MKKENHYLKLLILILIITLISSQIILAEKIKVDKYKFEYDEKIETETEEGLLTMYYLNDQMVLTTFDDDNDSKIDSWFSYTENDTKDLAMIDTSGNGKPNNIIGYDSSGNIIMEETKGEKLKKFIEYIKNISLMKLFLIIIAIIIVFLIISKRKNKKKKEKEKKKSNKKEKPKNHTKHKKKSH